MLIQTEFVIDKLDRKLLDSEPCVKIHGFLMKILLKEETDRLHKTGEVRPYSMYLTEENKYNVLHLQTLNEEAYHMVEALLLQKEISIYGMQNKIKIHSMETKSMTTLQKLQKRPIQEEFTITFITPATYKKENLYCNWYHLGRLLSSVVKKLNYYEGLDYDIKEIWGIEESVRLLDYKLESCCYKIMHKSLFGFKGKVHLKIIKTADIQTLNMILNYASYSGVGAKTALGMGGVFIQ